MEPRVEPKARAKIPSTTLLAGKVAVIVGAGPAGMSAAMNLARHGASVHVFDDRPQDQSPWDLDTDDMPPFTVLQSRGMTSLAASGLTLQDLGPSMRCEPSAV